MANYQDPRRNIVPRSGGFFQDLTNRFRLISRLLMDSRVNPLIKVLPVATLAYVVWPVDLLPVNPIDDAFVIWIGTTLFVQLCPPDVVNEHLRSFNRLPDDGQWQNTSSSNPSGDVVDGEYYEDNSGKPG